MRWLLHGNLSAAVADALRARGDVASTPQGLGIEAPDLPALIKAASEKQLDIITNDAGLQQALFSGAATFRRSVVFLQLAGDDVEQDDAIDRLFARYKRLTPGRLYTVTASRVKIRQLPST